MRSLSRSSAGLVAAFVDQRSHVAVELVAGALDRRQVLGEVVVEDAEDVGRPAREQLPVLLRRAEQLADDRDRVRLADIGDELAPPARRDRVDERR